LGNNHTVSIGIAGPWQRNYAAGALARPCYDAFVRSMRAASAGSRCFTPLLIRRMSSPSPSGDPAPASRRDATWLEVIPVVLASFFGVRKGKAMRQDVVSVRPHQVIVVGILAAALFVTCLVLLVRFIIRSTGA